MNETLSLTEALLALLLGATLGVLVVMAVVFYYLIRR